MLEQFLSQEEEEIESFYTTMSGQYPSDDDESVMTEYGSVDEEHDRLLLDALIEIEEQQLSGTTSSQAPQEQDMDVSMD